MQEGDVRAVGGDADSAGVHVLDVGEEALGGEGEELGDKRTRADKGLPRKQPQPGV